MSLLYPIGKGDPLCPLGFHPQVRWPTRCKRCFRDYKEHGGKRKDSDFTSTPKTTRKDDVTASSPSLAFGNSGNEQRRSWASSTTLDRHDDHTPTVTFKRPSSWTSTPDLGHLNDDARANDIPTVSLTLPLRKKSLPGATTTSPAANDTGQTKPKPAQQPSQPQPVPEKKVIKPTVFSSHDSLAARAKKLSAIKEIKHRERDLTPTPTPVASTKPASMTGSMSSARAATGRRERDAEHDLRPKASSKRDEPAPPSPTPPPTSPRSSRHRSRSDSLEPEDDDDAISLAGTESTETTTLVDCNEHDCNQQMASLREELKTSRAKCERLEREKSNILLRRLTAMDAGSKGTSAEMLKLQQKVNELQSQLDDYKDEKKSLDLKVKELEVDLDSRPAPSATQKTIDELRSKLLAAETLCEELMDENEDVKKELRDMEEEIEEMQDHFREDQADEYSTLKKELEQTTKNCRILSFKLRKTERRTEQLEQEKADSENKIKELSGSSGLQQLDKLKQMEKDLSNEKEVSSTLQKKLDEANAKLLKTVELKLPNTLPRRKAPTLGSLGKSASSELKVSRESLTRGGSQDDHVQLLRDLQDSLEREADLREQLKFAEEEGETLRKKASRIEDDNESLLLQLKKMATARPRASPLRKSSLSKDDKEEDPSVIKLQLELNEQELTVLRKRLGEMETDNERLRKQAKDLQEKVNAKGSERNKFVSKFDKDNVQSEKVKSLENEMNEIRSKLIEKERDCERLETEVNLTKRMSTSNRSRSQERLTSETTDLKRQLQVVEQEASVFRDKTQSLEAENERLQKDVKRLEALRGNGKSTSDKITQLEADLEIANKKIKELEASTLAVPKSEDLTKKLTLVERERDKLMRLLDKVKENTARAYKTRKPKAPTELTTKPALRTMVNDLENELQAILSTLGNKESELEKVEEELKSKTIKGTKDTTNKELEELGKRYDALLKENQKDKDKVDELNKSLTNGNVEREEYKLKVTKLQNEQDLLSNENKRLESEVALLKTDATALKEAKREIVDLKERIDKREGEIKKLKDEVDEKVKLSKELTMKTKKVAELQKKVKEEEEENARVDKINKEKIKTLEANVSEEKKKAAQEMESKEKLKTERDTLNSKIKELEKTIEKKTNAIETLEKDLQRERSATSVVIKSPAETKELKTLKEDNIKLKLDLQKAEDRVKKAEGEHKTEITSLERQITDLDSDLQAERKKLQLLKTNADKEQKNRELELTALKNKIKSLELSSSSGSTSTTRRITEFQDKIDKLEKDLDKEKKSYENLTAKYEVLEEEHVVTKAKLVSEMEAVTSQLFATRKELERLEDDHESTKDDMRRRYETLQKERNELLKKSTADAADNPRYKHLFEQKQEEIEQAKKENEQIHDQMEYMRRENDELRKKLDDYEKVSKIQRNISADSSAMDKEIRELKSKVSSLEKSKKSDLTECKMRYDSQITILNDEMQSLHNQVTRFKREKDTYKHMLESAQKTIGDLKTTPAKTKENRNSIASIDDMEEYKSKIASLEQQISCMEDELSESRLEASKLRTDLVSERSSFEVRQAEMNSRVNELEEEKILSSGRTKIVGLRTRMELSWQKEREDQQRLLQETATLARDLRQTLFEVERERDKDVLEGKRKMDQLKKTLDEEQGESKKKLNELQCDFMELRDAHAKLRTTNEKLRREKERHEKEREEMRALISEKKRSEFDDLRRVQILVQQVENLLQVAPELFGTRGERAGSEAPYTPTPPKRTKSKSREGSPGPERKDFSRESSVAREERRVQVASTLQRLVDATDELRKIQERDRIKRMHMRRATSTETDQVGNGGSGTLVTRKPTTRASAASGGGTDGLHRKSLSLEQTTTLQDRNIWRAPGDDDSMSSLQSLEMGSDLDFRYKRDASMDSRLSAGSTQSELAGDKKKKKTLMGKLKKLTKSRSIDDTDDATHFSPTRPLTSRAPSNSSDVSEDQTKGSKKDLKERITGMFKRSGSQSRSNSVERQVVKHDTSSTQRPLMRSTNGGSSIATTPNSSTDKLAKPKTVKKIVKA